MGAKSRRPSNVRFGNSAILVAIPLEAISNYVAVHDPDFDELNFDALNRIVVFAFAEMLGLEVGAEALQVHQNGDCKEQRDCPKQNAVRMTGRHDRRQEHWRRVVPKNAVNREF